MAAELIFRFLKHDVMAQKDFNKKDLDTEAVIAIMQLERK